MSCNTLAGLTFRTATFERAMRFRGVTSSNRRRLAPNILRFDGGVLTEPHGRPEATSVQKLLVRTAFRAESDRSGPNAGAPVHEPGAPAARAQPPASPL